MLREERQHLRDQARVVKDDLVRQLDAVSAALSSMQQDIDRLNGLAEHPAVTSQVAQRLQTCVREEDTVVRIGGDEFVLMLPELGSTAATARAGAEAVARKVLEALSDEYVLLNDQRFRSSGSVGITLFGYRSETEDQVLERADDAMYAAKAGGRNAYRFSEADVSAPLLN